MERSEHNWHAAIEHHGASSPQAEHARHGIAPSSRTLLERKPQMVGRRHRWRDQQDWDERDHERDH